MFYILRVKAVSDCMRIRRSALSYYIYKDGVIDLKDEPHPLKSFDKIIVDGNMATSLDKTEELAIGEDTFFYKSNQVQSLTSTVLERITMGIMILPLDIDMLNYYVDAINDGNIFDEWHGEFEYLLGMMYELSENDTEKANEWYQKALNKKFSYKLKK